jgi:hypothetical protein
MRQGGEMTSITALRDALAVRVDSLVPMLLPGAVRSASFWHAGDISGARGKSLYVRRHGTRAGKWQDSATGEFGDLIDLIAAAQQIDTAAAIRWARNYLGDRATSTLADHSKMQAERAKLDAEERKVSIAKALAIWNDCQEIGQ